MIILLCIMSTFTFESFLWCFKSNKKYLIY